MVSCREATKPDQSFRVQWVFFRFVVLTLIAVVPIEIFMWIVTRSPVHVLAFGIVLMAAVSAIAVRDYVVAGRLMRKIEAERMQKEAAGRPEGPS